MPSSTTCGRDLHVLVAAWAQKSARPKLMAYLCVFEVAGEGIALMEMGVGVAQDGELAEGH